ncbi:hypothetical protein IFM89_027319 [Coptis chinensis]|uniref:Uncharacterized protein n=1 Tax=Coptis chinensis TaxID=261450 RepID=A0A835HQ33_9MAGN|nr:hypothetical protein IFM89_027319 [Coptis chinensis]
MIMLSKMLPGSTLHLDGLKLILMQLLSTLKHAYATLAVVGRDHEGMILGACSKKMKATTFAEAELLVAELAVEFALL